MTKTEPRTDSPDVEVTARRIADAARKMWSDIDTARRLPGELVEMLRDSGLLRAGAPAEANGLELPPGVGLRAAEYFLARGDMSTGWCVSIGITSTLLVAYLPPSSRDHLFGDGRGLAAGVWAPRGKGRSVDGGVVVSGRMGLLQRHLPRRRDVLRLLYRRTASVPSVVAMPKEDLRLLDTWHTLGLRGTGSHDTVADEVFVPAEGVAVDLRWARRGPAPVPLSPIWILRLVGCRAGAGQCARGHRRARRIGRREERPWVNTNAGRARRDAGGGRDRRVGPRRGQGALLRGDRRRLAGQPNRGPGPVELRNRLRLAATHATRTSADVVRTMYDLAGGTAIRRFAVAATVPRRVHRHRALPGERGVARTARPDPAGPARRRVDV